MGAPIDDLAADWLASVRMLPCGCCGAAGPSFAHHIREGQGMAQRADHFLTIPLCFDCHQGPQGIHGDRTLWRIHKTDELTVLGATIRMVHRLAVGLF